MTMTRNDFAAHVTEWLEELPEDQHDWAEALLAAALDESHGNLEEALARARGAYEAGDDDPTNLLHPYEDRLRQRDKETTTENAVTMAEVDTADGPVSNEYLEEQAYRNMQRLLGGEE